MSPTVDRLVSVSWNELGPDVRMLGFRLMPVSSAASIVSPTSFESFTEDYRSCVHDHQEGQEHDDGAGGFFDKAALGTVGPQEDLHGQCRGGVRDSLRN